MLKKATLKQILFAKGFCKSKQKRTSEKEELYIEKALKRTVLTEKGPILLRKTLINTEDSYQTGYEQEEEFKSLIEKDRFCLKKSLIKNHGFVFVEKEYTI